MPKGFLPLPETQDLVLVGVRVPAVLLADPSGFAGEFAHVDIELISGKIGRIFPTGIVEHDLLTVELDRDLVLPTFVELHTHIDKGHIWPRAANPDGTFWGALNAVRADTTASWSADDVRRRMHFSLQCAYAHGTSALRTHLDSIPPQDDISFGVFKEMRSEWAGRVDLQAVTLIRPDEMVERDLVEKLAIKTKALGGLMGGFIADFGDVRRCVGNVIDVAAAYGLELDIHVDENENPASDGLKILAQEVIARGFSGKVTAGHCCALARKSDDAIDETLDLVAKAGINVVSLPMCNMYLQDRHRLDDADLEHPPIRLTQSDRQAAAQASDSGAISYHPDVPIRAESALASTPITPRWRGVTLLHEMKARGINVCVSSDNTRDPFYAYGDLDMIEVWREATRILHLDHPVGTWPHAVSRTPAQIMGIDHGLLKTGASADLVIARARNWTELFARPQMDRTVLRGGKAISTQVPDYRLLDDLAGFQP